MVGCRTGSGSIVRLYASREMRIKRQDLVSEREECFWGKSELALSRLTALQCSTKVVLP
jgi:hypothetical protein